MFLEYEIQRKLISTHRDIGPLLVVQILETRFWEKLVEGSFWENLENKLKRRGP
jgi:hypothetical protein